MGHPVGWRPRTRARAHARTHTHTHTHTRAHAHAHAHAHFVPTSNAPIPANSQHACRLSRPAHEPSDRTTYARRPADPTERPTHFARRTTARRPGRGGRAAASTREPCERCGAPERCRRPPERGQGGAGGQQGLVAGQPCDTGREPGALAMRPRTSGSAVASANLV